MNACIYRSRKAKEAKYLHARDLRRVIRFNRCEIEERTQKRGEAVVSPKRGTSYVTAIQLAYKSTASRHYDRAENRICSRRPHSAKGKEEITERNARRGMTLRGADNRADVRCRWECLQSLQSTFIQSR